MMQAMIIRILQCVGLILLSVLTVWGAPPQWQVINPATTGSGLQRQSPAVAEKFELQCPAAYTGIKGELLPTYWEPIDKAQAVELIKSQVQNQYFYCVYRIPSSGRDIHSSIRRLLPEGYNCLSDGAGRFECRSKEH